MTETGIVSGEQYLPVHIANYFLLRDSFKDIKVMKLTKLVYFGYAWYLAAYDEKLFFEKIEAWKHGPVIPSIYHEFKRFGSSTITEYAINYNPDTEEKEILGINDDDRGLLQVLAAVWETYKNKSSYDLRSITHEAGSPWKEVFMQGENIHLEDARIKERARQAIESHYGNGEK